MHEIWLELARASKDPAVVACRLKNFIVIGRCERRPSDSASLVHDFGFVNHATYAHVFSREVHVESGTYAMNDGKEKLVIPARPKSLSEPFVSWESGICGSVAPNPPGPVRVLTKLTVDASPVLAQDESVELTCTVALT